MKRLVRILLPALVLFGGIGVATSLIWTGPKTERKRPKVTIPTVEILELHPQDYQVLVPSRGTLSPRSSSTLVTEVSGRIIQVADNFRTGGFFAAGDLLLQVDPRDYENAVTISRASLTQKQLNLYEQLALSNQAQRDWQDLNLEGNPTPLTLRAPQRANAEAELAAAQAELMQTEIELERTRILAPYAGRILSQKVDIGQYVSPGTPLADIFASDAIEIRLPISSEDQRYLQLPENFLNDKQTDISGAKVLFLSQVGEQSFKWEGQLVRTEGAIDIQSRQLFVIGQINDPYVRKNGSPALKIGQFLEAKIFGKQLKEVFVLPRTAVRGAGTVQLIDADNRLQRRNLNILWRDKQNLIASGPLSPGDRLSLTALPFAANGSKVQIAEGKKNHNSIKIRQEP
jgi:RND family efflux transporter MFP subunit